MHLHPSWFRQETAQTSSFDIQIIWYYILYYDMIIQVVEWWQSNSDVSPCITTWPAVPPEVPKLRRSWASRWTSPFEATGPRRCDEPRLNESDRVYNRVYDRVYDRLCTDRYRQIHLSGWFEWFFLQSWCNLSEAWSTDRTFSRQDLDFAPHFKRRSLRWVSKWLGDWSIVPNKTKCFTENKTYDTLNNAQYWMTQCSK